MTLELILVLAPLIAVPVLMYDFLFLDTSVLHGSGVVHGTGSVHYSNVLHSTPCRAWH
jgi:hypothetical protein